MQTQKQLINYILYEFDEFNSIFFIEPVDNTELNIHLTTTNPILKYKFIDKIVEALNGFLMDKKTGHIEIIIPIKQKINVLSRSNTIRNSSADHGFLEFINLKKYDVNEFFSINTALANKTLPSFIGDSLVARGISLLNKRIMEQSQKNISGINISLGSFNFKNIISAVNVSSPDSTANIVLVSNNNFILKPECYISLKGTKDNDLFITKKKKTDLFGKDYKNAEHNKNNVHAVVQGSPFLTGGYLSYPKILLNNKRG